MTRAAWLLVLLVATPAAGWDSRCYLATPVPDPTVPGGVRAECKVGPETARNRWIGPSDEHRALLELGRIAGGLPHAVSGDTPLPVFTGDTPVDVAGQQEPSLQPVNFADTKRQQDRTMSVPELAQLPDQAYSLWDWALGDETCPVDAAVPAQDCHDFGGHMGPVNSNHFVPQSGAFYAYYHSMALQRAADCARLTTRLGSETARFADFQVACEREALMIEAVGQHFLQDAWASGHMWERWGSPDPADFGSLTDALLVAMTSGLIHGARAVLETLPDLLPDIIAAQVVGFQFNDPLNAPDPAVGFRSPGDTATHAGLGDLYLTDLLAGQSGSFRDTYTRLLSCEAAGLRAVYAAAGAPEGALPPLGPPFFPVDPTSDSCFGQRVTNQAMVKGIGLDFSLADGTPERLELDSLAATQLVPALSKRAGGTPTPAETAQYQVDMAHIVAVARLTGQASPDGVELASGVLPPLLGIQANGQYVKSVLAPYVDPPPPWPAASGTGAATDRAAALARTFHRAHAIDWCNRFRGGSPDRLDVDVLRANAATAKQTGAPQEEIDARRAVCEEFAARHLRVGTGETSYDTSREPLCHFLADDPASTQYVYQPGGMSDDVPTLAAIYCGGLTVSVDPPTAVVPSGGTQQFTATVHGATDQHVTWTIVSGDETTDATIDDTGLFTAGAPGTVTVRATSVVAAAAFTAATVTVVASSCGSSFSKELILGNHEQSQTFELDNQAGVIDESLPSDVGFSSVSSGNVDFRSISLTADDPDTRNDVKPFGSVTAVAAFALVGDGIVLNASNPALQGTDVTFDLSVQVTASIDVTGDHASGRWSVNSGGAAGLNVHAVVSTIAGQSDGNPTGGMFTASLPGRIGTQSGIGFTVSASAGVICDPTETCPPPPGFTGSAKVQVAMSVLGISNVRDHMGNPITVSICSASGTGWGP